MTMASWRNPGLALVLGALELIFLEKLAEILYPGYSVSQNVISDLGVGPEPSRLIFTSGLIVFGLLVLASAYLRGSPKSLITILFILSGVGAIGVAVFNENLRGVHLLFAGLAFGMGCLTAIVSSRTVKSPLSMVFATLGVIGLVALILQTTKTFLGLGVGGMERMIFLPSSLWVLAYGVYLMAREDCQVKVGQS
jgi:hypothetical membrane protein